MRKKSMQNNNYGHKKRHGGGRHNGPRKNYGAAREKYMAQARDALSSGDRVMAEYYYQHAEHCVRMLNEEGSKQPARPNRPAQPAETADDTPNAADDKSEQANEAKTSDAKQLPAFITSAKGDNTAAAAAPEAKES